MKFKLGDKVKYVSTSGNRPWLRNRSYGIVDQVSTTSASYLVFFYDEKDEYVDGSWVGESALVLFPESGTVKALKKRRDELKDQIKTLDEAISLLGGLDL